MIVSIKLLCNSDSVLQQMQWILKENTMNYSLLDTGKWGIKHTLLHKALVDISKLDQSYIIDVCVCVRANVCECYVTQYRYSLVVSTVSFLFFGSRVKI